MSSFLTTPRRFVIGGGSGFIGKALTHALRAQGHSVTWISRNSAPPSSAGMLKMMHTPTLTWVQLEKEGLPPCDVVINLAGKHILNLREKWDDAYKQELLSSRVGTTKMLVDAVNKMPKGDAPTVFVSTAGKCFYGIDGDTKTALDEYTDTKNLKKDFAADMVHLWDQAASHIDRNLVERHLRVNIGVVLGEVKRERMAWLRLGSERGFLPLIRLPFCLGLGGYLGTGQQLFPWVHLDDVVNLLIHLINNQSCDGRYNAVSPGICNNLEFTNAFAKYLHRKIRWHIPADWITWVVGKDRATILLAGQMVKPTRTLESGYKFQYTDIDSACKDLVKISF